jgi:glutaconyl-CoA/methylmalonyl-CoA decarboxylase subunit gamma
MKNFKFNIDSKQYEVEVGSIDDNIAKVYVNGKLYTVEVDRQLKMTKTPTLVRTPAIPSTDSSPSTAKTANPNLPKGAGVIKSPLPGTIADVLIKVGDKVSAGQDIIVLEAMKMENSIKSSVEGVVSVIHVQKGSAVLEGDTLLEIK